MYLDTSALVPLHIEERSSIEIDRFLATLPTLPTIRDYGLGEFAAVISRYVRMDKVSQPEAALVLDQFDDWVAAAAEIVATSPGDIRRAISIVRRFELKLRMPDALHVAVCLNHELPLLTRDHGMADAATAPGIEVTLIA